MKHQDRIIEAQERVSRRLKKLVAAQHQDSRSVLRRAQRRVDKAIERYADALAGYGC